MFTGIVETMGTVTEADRGGGALRMTLDAPGLAVVPAVGDSVCVSGVCLTVVSVSGSSLTFQAVEETLQRSTLQYVEVGSRVNLERSLSLGTLLGGHLVQGHVDGMGTVSGVEVRGAEKWITVEVPDRLMRYVVEKGSIAMDGVSLTVAGLDSHSLSVAIIPHTAEVTTIGEWAPGTRVNLEADIFAKHLEKLVEPYLARWSVTRPPSA